MNDNERKKIRKWLIDRPSFCTLPLAHLTINPNGNATPCCISDPIEDRNGIPLNIKDYTISEMWNHPARHKFVKDLFDGKKPKQCQKCWSEKDQSNAKRVHFSLNRKMRNTTKEIYENKINVDVDNFDYKLKWLDIFPGNTCNLKCRICYWEYSSLWAKDFNKIKNPGLPFKNSELHEYNKSCQWINEPNVWKNIDNTFKDLEIIHILGGEPLMVTGHFDMLQELIKRDYAQNIAIDYNTNVTYFFTEDQLDILKQFKKLYVNLSIDDIGHRFEYQRKNAVWKKVEENVIKFQNLKEQMGAEIVLDPAISIFNVLYVWDFFKHFENKGIKEISLGHWVHSNGLDIRELSIKQRKKVLDQIDRGNNPEWIQTIVDRLKFSNFKELDIDSRRLRINLLDEVRNESFKKTFPEIYEIIKEDL